MYSFIIYELQVSDSLVRLIRKSSIWKGELKDKGIQKAERNTIFIFSLFYRDKIMQMK